MDGGDSLNYSAAPVLVTEGEWAGWRHPAVDPFEHLTGPYYWRLDPDGTPRCAFRAEQRHMNGGGFMHGGCQMSFADFTLFVIAQPALKDRHAVTAGFNCEFLGPARVGDLIEGAGEIVKAGRSMVYVRGLITASGRPLLAISGILKKTGPRT